MAVRGGRALEMVGNVGDGDAGMVSLRGLEPSDKVEVMDFPDHIEVRSDVMMGKPCLKGIRIPVYFILEKLAAGETSQDILAAYPQLKPEHIKASLEYAARIAADEIVLANE